MSEPVTIYSSSYAPDPTNAVDVLAFVLTPVAAFSPESANEPDVRSEIETMLHKAKAEAIATWYQHALERRRC